MAVNQIKTNLIEKAAETSTNNGVKFGFLQAVESLDYTKDKLSRVVNAYVYKGTVATTEDLPAAENHTGDVYNVESDGGNYAWDGTAWDALGSSLTLEAGDNIDITDGVISATDTTYTAGDGISISNGVISVSYPMITEV